MPKTLKSGERRIVLKAKEFCEREKRNEAPLIPLRCVQARVAAITGVCEKTVTKITKEGEVAARTSTKVSTPRKSGPRPKRIDLDDFERCAIRHKIHEFYSVKKELPTLTKLLHEMKSEIDFKGSRTTLWRIMKEMGFYFKKCRSKRNVLMERPDIVAWRYRFLEVMRQNRIGNQCPVVYLDETYIHATYCAGKCWQSEKEQGALSSDSKGPRWIIVHAGGAMGFIPNAQLIFRSQSQAADYHDDMNQTNFNKWLSEKLIPNLPPQSIVVMDNASYHTVQVNKAPTMSSTKTEMQNWITSNDLSYLPTMIKAQLFEIIKEHRQPPVYEADRMLEEHGHKVVRLPPYHCDLNPIELIWSVLKRRIAEKNVGQEANKIVQITEEAFATITEADWRK
ncbi:uncharacterized protein LOC124530527 [Vanessa cardui]|uniref:uncharacterized protein LOC124530527 n=1 Tax=Vanessa cardui TaxID=171605 RepID=UPI001F132982|nr:uncharacterized protein LOC124530527 [Vanessa cardui]